MNGNSQWEWEGNGTKTRQNLVLGMGIGAPLTSLTDRTDWMCDSDVFSINNVRFSSQSWV